MTVNFVEPNELKRIEYKQIVLLLLNSQYKLYNILIEWIYKLRN